MVLVDDLVEKYAGYKIFIYQWFFKNSVNSEKNDVARVASKKIQPCGTKFFKKIVYKLSFSLDKSKKTWYSN